MASGQFTSVSGGYDNEASGTWASVSAGREGLADGEFSSVSGGYQNTVDASVQSHGSITGGRANFIGASTKFATITGGYANTISYAGPSPRRGWYTTILGGNANSSSVDYGVSP